MRWMARSLFLGGVGIARIWLFMNQGQLCQGEAKGCEVGFYKRKVLLVNQT